MFRRLRNLFRPNRLEAEIREELEFHLARTGGSFGNIAAIQDQTRAASTIVWLETLVHDIRFGCRQLRKAPVLSLVAVLSLGLGIGANTAIFSLMNAVLLRSLPVARPSELSLLVKTSPQNSRGNFSFPFARLLTSDARSFSGVLITTQPGRSKISIGGIEQNVATENVSANYFGVLGLAPAAGRFFLEGEDRPGAPDYAVISHSYWRRQVAMDPAAVGKTIEKGGELFTIVGVAPPEFFGISVGSAVDVWTTLSRVPKGWIDNPGMNFLQIIGRRRDGVTQEAAQAESHAIYQNHARSFLARSDWTPREKEMVLGNRVIIEPGATGLSSLRLQYSKPLQLLLAITALVLLVACANIANLLLARAAARRKEIAMRLAIGAARGRLIRQLITESLLLAGLGGVLALWFAYGGARLLVTLMSSGRRDRPLILDSAPDWRVLLFSAALTLVVGLAFGLAPALRAIRASGLAERVEVGRAGFGKLLICVQVALTIVLLAGSGLFLRTLRNLQTVPLGYDADRLYRVEYSFRKGIPDASKSAIYTQLPEGLGAVPGVLSATLVQPSGGSWTNNVTIPSYSSTEQPVVHRYRIAPGFAAAMRILIAAGRDFTPNDSPNAPRVTVINQSLARRYFGGRDPVGQFIQFPSDSTASRIVGVLADTRVQGLRNDPPAIAYTPLTQSRDIAVFGPPVALVRVADAMPDIGSAIQALHPGVKFERGVFLKDQFEGELVQERMLAVLSGFFGGLALALACIGMYGVLSYVLARRTTEIGVRLALGARPRRVVGIVLWEYGIVVGLGLAAGTAAVIALSRLVRQFLFGLQPNDPATIVAAGAVLSVVAVVSMFVPAARASRLDPMSALRTE